MNRIDLRYPLAIAAFYLPGLLVLGGAMALGFHLREVRDFIAVFGMFFGGIAVALFAFNVRPIWWEFRG